jgi:membrane protease YdiL (CAAX protease family)
VRGNVKQGYLRNSVFLYSFTIVSGLVFLFLLQPLDTGTASWANHFYILLFVSCLLSCAVFLDAGKKNPPFVARFMYLFGLYYLTNYLWNVAYHLIRTSPVAADLPRITVSILSQLPAYVIPLTLILFFGFRYKDLASFRLRWGKISAPVTIAGRWEFRSWMLISVFTLVVLVPYIGWSSGFTENPVLTTLIPANLTAAAPLLLYSCVEIARNEIFFRGFLLREAETPLGMNGALIFQACLYGLPHYLGGNPGGPVGGTFALLGGLAWGFFTQKTNGISLAILAHVVMGFVWQLYTR